MSSSPNPWTQSPTHAGLVFLGIHSLFLAAAGPPRTAGQAVVILEAGYGGCSSTWAAVMRAVSPFARIYSYDRSGYGRSEISPAPRTACNIAAELSALLDAAGVAGPFVLVGHSYGGILVREFLDLRKGDVMGMVLVDTLQEADLRYAWPFAEVRVLSAGLDSYAIRGLDESHQLTPEEWKVFLDDEKREGHGEASKREFEQVPSASMALAEKKQFDGCVLQDRPLSVIKGEHVRDYRLLYENGVKAGNGSTKQRDTLKKWIDGIDEVWEKNQRQQLMLSRNGRMVYARHSGHQVALQQPILVAEEIKWVLDSCGC